MPLIPDYLVGIDVGSTTVKAVVVTADGGPILWEDYQRHETRQPEMLLDFLKRMEREVGIAPANARIFMTGSGASALAPFVGARFVQEVVAIAAVVEARHPDAGSVIELGGQDAKIIVFGTEAVQGSRTKVATMNDRCAGGTGAVIDKIAAKLGIAASDLANQGYAGLRVHPVAGKCGVFAETDINSLQKQGVPRDELMASLFDAIVLQNLTVLARGNTLRPRVLLLGGPNTFIRGMREAWQREIPRLWAERKIDVPAGAAVEDLIVVPERAQYFAALGAAESGRTEEFDAARYRGTAELVRYLRSDRLDEKACSGAPALGGTSGRERETFLARYTRPAFAPPAVPRGQAVPAFLGIDGGSTSTKAVLVTEAGAVLAKAYRLSNGNPIQDVIDLLPALWEPVTAQGARIDVLGAATTGYAKDILRDVFAADVALVETVAHARAALHAYPGAEVIVDVGGQDIKLIVMRDGRVKDFRLNTQCSAGNGYFLQATAEALGIPVARYAERAFAATRMPLFGYGCAVFLQADIVNAQRQGWNADEILAGLAAVLPKNIFYYVAAVSSPARLGHRFVLQGGTQRNLAVVKAEVDFLTSAFARIGTGPEIVVHEHCGESGAIGAALEAVRLWRNGRTTTFIGFDAARAITYQTTSGEGTRCSYCRNACLRTFVDVEERPTAAADARPAPGRRPRRFIIASCEKGAASGIGGVRDVKAEIDAIKAANPNLVDLAARLVWQPAKPRQVGDPPAASAWTPARRARAARVRRRAELRIGIPRVLNLYTYAPFFSGYLESLGVRARNIVFSDYTSDALYRTGSARGAIDPCFPSKVAIAHVHNLLRVKHARHRLDCIFFPMIDVLDSPLVKVRASNACPTSALTPEVVKAAFMKERDVFGEAGVVYLDPLVDFSDRPLIARQLLDCWKPILGLSAAENRRADDEGYRALDACWSDLRARGRAVVEQLEREHRLGIVVLGRAYHHDPGINHGILDELQKLGYPVLSQSTLPRDADVLEALFGDEVREGAIGDPLEIDDVWKNASVASTNQKLWAAKFTARHPHLVAVELSSFKCGHDAPVYSVVEQIVECSGTPFFAFKDIDENRSLASIRIRIETIDYFLRRYREQELECWRADASAASLDSAGASSATVSPTCG